MDTTQYSDLFLTHREVFSINTANKNPIVVDANPSINQQSSFLIVEKNIFSSTE